MKIVLLRDISRLGQKGSIKEVANGYAMNVLIPRGWAKQATEGIIHELKAKEDAKKKQKEIEQSIFLQLVEKLRLNPIRISGLKHQNGSLFAHVSSNQIIDAIYKAHAISLNPKQIHVREPIKRIGVHDIELEEGGSKEKIQVIIQE